MELPPMEIVENISPISHKKLLVECAFLNPSLSLESKAVWWYLRHLEEDPDAIEFLLEKHEKKVVKKCLSELLQEGYISSDTYIRYAP